MAALSKAASNYSDSIDMTDLTKAGLGGAQTYAAPLTVASQIEFVLSLAQSHLDFMQKNGTPAAATAYMASALAMVRPLMAQYLKMLNLLIKAGVEINGNPFLDEETILPEIRAFLANKDIAGILHEAMPALPTDQVEILEDLIGRNSLDMD